MQGGGIVRFFHRKHECYIVAEGSFAGRFATLDSIPELVVSREANETSLDPSNTNSANINTRSEEELRTTLGAHSQVVEVEVHDRGDNAEDEPLQSAPIPSSSMHNIDRSFSLEDSLSLGVTNRVNTLSDIDSCSAEYMEPFLDGDTSPDENVVTYDGKCMNKLMHACQ